MRALSKWKAFVNSLALIVVFQFCGACSIMMASRLPIARPPEYLQQGKDQSFVDHHYGFPLAYGHDGNGMYAEQIQFINGTPIGWKVARFCIHGALDACTYCIWELIGTPIEICHSEYPIYVYYVVYDAEGKIVKAVNADSQEGKAYGALDWTLPRDPKLKVNMNDEVRRQIGYRIVNDTVLSLPSSENPDKSVTDTTPSRGEVSSFEELEKLKDEGAITEEEYNRRVLRFLEIQ